MSLELNEKRKKRNYHTTHFELHEGYGPHGSPDQQILVKTLLIFNGNYKNIIYP